MFIKEVIFSHQSEYFFFILAVWIWCNLFDILE